MTDKDRGAKPQPNEILPADESLEDEEFVEADEEFEEEPQAAAAVAAPAAERPRRGSAETPRKPLGSLRESHERVHIDDRLSAVFAILAAIALLAVLILPFVGSYLPAPAQPTLTPLAVPTFNGTQAPAASATVAPTATPAASPSAS
jgi:hypothetical protein